MHGPVLCCIVRGLGLNFPEIKQYVIIEWPPNDKTVVYHSKITRL